MNRTATIVALALALSSVAANCQQCNQITQARRGNVDRVTDAVLVKGSDNHSYLFTTNPELQHLRVLDLTTARFVDSPNRYFPASIPVGPETRRITSAPGDDTRVFALDASADEIFVVRTKTTETTGVDFSVVGTPIPTGDRAPGDIAALKVGDQTQLFVTFPDQHLLRMITLSPDPNANVPTVDVDLGADASPGDVVVDPQGDSIVVADTILPVVHVVEHDSLAAGPPRVHRLDVGGPQSDLSVGVVDVGDGLASVVLALRSDDFVAAAIRLRRPGFREASFQVLGTAELPAYPLVGYVPDNRATATVCCHALTTEAVNAGEASSAWAAVGMADGQLIYLRLAAPISSTRQLVRPFDTDTAAVALGVTVGTDWAFQPGDEDRRPTPTLTQADTFGDPPFVPLLQATEDLLLVWEGPPPGLSDIAGTLEGAQFHAEFDVAAAGARTGDLAVLTPAERAPGCTVTTPVVVTVTAVSGADVSLTAPDADHAPCLVGAGTISMDINAANAFVAFRGDGVFLGRLAFTGPESSVALPGALLTLAPSTAGPPQERGSTLHIPIDPHVTTLLLGLSDPPVSVTLGGGGFGSAGFLPLAITGGAMDVPSPVQGTLIRNTRRLQIGTGSVDSNGLNTVFSCDEGESIPDLCDQFK